MFEGGRQPCACGLYFLVTAGEQWMALTGKTERDQLQSLTSKGSGQNGSCWLLPEQGFRNPLFAVEMSLLHFGQYYADPTLSALHQEVSNTLWRKKHQSHLPTGKLRHRAVPWLANHNCLHMSCTPVQYSVIRLHQYSAIPKLDIIPVRASEFRDRQENSASPTPHPHIQTLSLPSTSGTIVHYPAVRDMRMERPLPSSCAQQDTVKMMAAERLGTQRSSYKECVSEECSFTSYCLPGAAAGWCHSPSSPERPPSARKRQDRTERGCYTHSLRCSASELPRVRANISNSSSSLPEVSRERSAALTLLEPRSVGGKAG